MDRCDDKTLVTTLLTEAITMLCSKRLKFESEFSIEGLLGITLDKKDILLVNINEIVTSNVKLNEVQDQNFDAHNLIPGEQILRRPEEIFPKRRKRRKASTVSKRKVSYSEQESPFANTNENLTKPMSPCLGLDDSFVGDDLSLKGIKNTSFSGIIPTLCENDLHALSYDDATLKFEENPNTSNGVLDCKYDPEQLDHLEGMQPSPKMNFGEGMSLDLGLSNSDTNNIVDDWNSTLDKPLNLSEAKPDTIKQEKTISCQNCGKIYKSEYNLKRHRCKGSATSPPPTLDGGGQPLDLSLAVPCSSKSTLDSLDLEADLDDPLLNEQYNCICSRTFSDYSAYMDHVNGCYKAKLTPYKACEICGKYFFSNSGYVKHKRLHVGAYKFRCDVCKKGFFDRTHLRAHMDSSHSKVRRYECRFCFKSFFWKHHLKRHLGTCEAARATTEPSSAGVISDGGDGEMILGDFPLKARSLDL